MRSNLRLFALYGLPLVVLSGCTIENGVRSLLDPGASQPDSPDSGDTGAPVDTDPYSCEAYTFPGRAIAQTEECLNVGETVDRFTPAIEWKKDSFTVAPGDVSVMMMPAVGPLTDDNGDGVADANDTPDIVFITYGSGYPAGTLRVVSGADGAEHLNIPDQNVQATGGVAIGDVDGDGWADIVVPTADARIKMFDHRGRLQWTSVPLTGHIQGSSDNPAISDMDGDGAPEIICGNAILDGQGRVVGKGTAGMAGVNGQNVGTTAFAVDIDGDGHQEVVTGNALYNRDGTLKASNRGEDGYPAVGNFDDDAKAEIVVVSGGTVRLQDDDLRVLCSASIPGADSVSYGGPPTVADFDGDGEAEFAAAAGSRYTVFERDCSVKWQTTTQDATSGNTGSSVFDFEGDGAAEAVYADETMLWAFNGADGAVKLQSGQHTNGTWLEYPVIADVDGDGHAEIVVPNTSGKQGIYVFGDAANAWMPGRTIWNQHAYHISNVNDDGTIPTKEEPNWLRYNSFRSGDLAPAGGYAGPDLTVAIRDVCSDECDRDRLTVSLQVANPGYQAVEPGVSLQLYGELETGEQRLLHEQTVSEPILAGRSLDSVTIVVDPVPTNLVRLYAKVDAGNSAVTSEVAECAETNNEDVYGAELCASRRGAP